MNSLEKHIQQTLALSNSLVIKISDIAVNVNRALSVVPYAISSDKRQWKYYLNMAGKLHDSNQNFEVKLVETEDTIKVGRGVKENIKVDRKGEPILDEDGNKIIYYTDYLFSDLLEDYPYTKQELIKQDIVYKKLINAYPDEEPYIKGCLFPVDIDTAINAKDGTILNYNKDLIEASEYNLIRELEDHIVNFLKRWHVKAYTITDELYIPAMVGVLYASLPNKILNIRLDKILTNEVHSFHMEQYFRSNLDIWDSLQIFKNETRYWLYKNLPYLIKHTGTNEVLDLVINKIFEANGIGVGEYTLERPDPLRNQMLTEEEKKDKSSYINQEPRIVASQLNSSYDIDTSGVTIDSLLNNEIRLTNQEFSDEKVVDTIRHVMVNKLNDIHNFNFNKQTTKIIDVKISRVFKRTGTDIFKTIIEYWCYLCKIEALNGKFEWDTDDAYDDREGKVRPLIEFTDPNTKTLYSLTPIQGFLFALKLMLSMTNQLDNKIKSFRYSTVFNADKYSLRYAYAKMMQDGWTDTLIDQLIENYPKINTYIYNQYSFNDYLNKIFQFQYYIWALDANSESIIVSANIKYLLNMTIQNGEFILSENEDGDTIDQLIANTGMNFNIADGYKPLLALNALINAFTGYDIDEYYVKEEIIESCKDILNKLTAYTTQVLTTSDTTSSVYLFYNNTGIWRAKNPVIGDINAELHGHEHNFFKIDVQGKNIIEDPMVILVNNDLAQAGYEPLPPVDGFGYYENVPDVFSKKEAPRAIAEVSEIFNFDLTKAHLDEEKEKEPEKEKEFNKVSDPVYVSGPKVIFQDTGTARFEFRCDKDSKINILVPTGKGIARVVSEGAQTLIDYDSPDLDTTETITIHLYSTIDEYKSNLVPFTITVMGNE